MRTVKAPGERARRTIYRSQLRPSLRTELTLLASRRDLLWALAVRDVRVRYRQSVLGIGWAVVQPLALTVLFSLVFSLFLKVGTSGRPYVVIAVVAIVPWTFMANTLQMTTSSVVNNAALLTKVNFPREVFPLAQTLAGLFDLSIALLVLLVVLLAYHVPITPWYLMVLPVILAQSLLTIGLGFLASAFTVFYRDIRHVVPLALQLWLFATPVAYPLSVVPARFRAVYNLNPAVGIIDTYRRVLVLGDQPDWPLLLWSVLCALIAVALGYWTFKRAEPRFADVV